MSDLISREAAIEAFEKELSAKYNRRELAIVFIGIKSILEKLPSAQRWIPVTEGLPEEEKDVLVTVFFHGLTTGYKHGWNDHIKPKRYVEVANYFDGDWYSYSDEYKVAKNRHEVIAWMPLPEPWRGEEDE